MSDSVQPPGLEPARLLCPWDSPGYWTILEWSSPPGRHLTKGRHKRCQNEERGKGHCHFRVMWFHACALLGHCYKQEDPRRPAAEWIVAILRLPVGRRPVRRKGGNHSNSNNRDRRPSNKPHTKLPKKTLSDMCAQPSAVSDSFAIPWTVAHQAPLSVGFSRQENWSGLLFPSLGDLDDPVMEPGSPALHAGYSPSEPLLLIFRKNM